MTDATRTAYVAGLNRWLTFVHDMTGNNALSLVDLSPARLRAQLSASSLYPAAFVLHCYDARLQPGSVSVYLAGVRFFATDTSGAPDPTPAPVARLLAGYRVSPPTQPLSSRVLGTAARPPADLATVAAAARLLWQNLAASGVHPDSFSGPFPATGSQLGVSGPMRQMAVAPGPSVARAVRDARMLACVLVGFFGALRASEYLLAPTQEAQLRLRDTKLFAPASPFRADDQLHLRLRRSKTNPQGSALQVRILQANAENPLLCPLLAVHTYVQLRLLVSPPHPDGDEPLFALSDRGPIPLNWFNQSLRAVFRSAGIPAERFSSHCLRIGAATEVFALSGGDPALTAGVGGWKSGAWDAYVRDVARNGVQTSAQSVLIAASAPAALARRNPREGWDRAPSPRSPLPAPLPQGTPVSARPTPVEVPPTGPLAVSLARNAALAEAAALAHLPSSAPHTGLTTPQTTAAPQGRTVASLHPQRDPPARRGATRIAARPPNNGAASNRHRRR